MEIPTYAPQQTGINLGPTPQADTRPRDDRASSLAPGLDKLASGLNSLAGGQQVQDDALRRSLEQQDLTRTAIAVTGVHADLVKSLNDDENGIFNDPSGVIDPNKFSNLTDKYHKLIGDATQKIVGEASTDKGKAFAATHLATLYADHYLPKTLAIQAKAGAEFAVNNINGTIANAAYGVGNDASMFKPLLNLTEQSINGSENLPFAQKAKLLDHARTEIAWAAVNSQIRADPGSVAVRSKGPLAKQAALQGVVQGTSPYVEGPPVVGTPITEAPPEVVAQMQAAEKSGAAVSWTPEGGLVTGRRDKSGVMIPDANTPAQVTANIAPAAVPPTPPTDDEISQNVPAWKYLTPEHRQAFRNQATTLLNQQGASALTAAKQHLADVEVAAKQYIPDPTPMPHAWYVQNFGENSREEQRAVNLQIGAHAAQDMMTKPDADIQAIVAGLKPEGIGKPGQWDSYKMVLDLSGMLTKEKAAALNDKVQQQMQLGLTGNDPGASLPKAEFAKAGVGEHYDDYLKDMDNLRQRSQAKSMSDSDLRAYRDSQAVTADTPDAVAQFKRYQVIAPVADDLLKARAADPADFVLRTNTPINQLYAQAQKNNNPAAWDAYFQASKAEQLRLTGSYALTSKTDRQNITSILSAPLTDNDGAAARAQKLQAQYGKNWEEVAVEVQQDPKASIPAWFYGTVGTNLPYAQAKAAQLAAYDVKELRKQVDPAQVTAAHSAMLREFAPLFASLGVTAGNQTPLAGLLEVTEKGMLADLRSNPSMSADQAAKQNAAPYVGMYTYFHNRGQGQSNTQFAVPNDQDPNKVATGAQMAVNQVANLKLAVPVDLTGRYKKDEAATEWATDVRNNPVWSLNRGGDGLVLSAVDRFGTLRPVLTPEGPQYGYTFEALRNNVESRPGYGVANPEVQQRLRQEDLRLQLGVR